MLAFNATLDFIVPVPVQLGSLVNAGAWAFCNPNDTTPLDNHDSISLLAAGSYDPNNKSVQPDSGITNQQIAAGQYLTYTIHFQNTGTASAINVRVVDTLNSGLDISTFNFITSSVPATWSIDGGVLTVWFNNVNLPDSGQSQTGSQGFFTYRIRPFPNLPVGDQIYNIAYIYFDFNPPIITDTAHTLIGTFINPQPQPHILCSGETLILTLGTNIPASVAWYLDSIPTGFYGDTLMIDSVTAAEAGTYYAQITTSSGIFYSESATSTGL